MTNDTCSEQEAAWPTPSEQQVLQLFEQSSREVRVAAKPRVGRPPTVTWSHLCLAIMLCFPRGWNAQLEVWRLIRSEYVGHFAPVKVCDQAIYNRIERATTALSWLFAEVSAWLGARLAPWQDRRLAPWASAVYATDASTLDGMSRFLPGCARWRWGTHAC